MVTGVRASGRRAESVRSVARFTLLGALPDAALRDGHRLPGTCVQRTTVHQDPGGKAVGRAGREASRGGAVVTGLAHPIHLGHAESVWVQPARHRHQSRNCPSHHSVGGTEGRQRQQFTVDNGCEHRRRHAECHRSRRPQEVQDDGRRRCPGAAARARRRRRYRRPPAHAAARSLAAARVARPRPTRSRHPPALLIPAGHRRGPDLDPLRTTAGTHRPEPMTPAPPAVPPRPRSPATRVGWHGAGVRVPARHRLPHRRRPPQAARPAGPMGRRAVTPAHASRPLSPSVATFGAHDAPPAERAVTCRPDHLNW